MAANSALALRNLLHAVSSEQYPNPITATNSVTPGDPASMSSSSSSSRAADQDPGSTTIHNLKRHASLTFEGLDEDSRKRAKVIETSMEADVPQANPTLDEGADTQSATLSSESTPSSNMLDDLETELLCGCCSALIYRPVIVYPCEHYFCGRWVFPVSDNN